jgi:hypothetical protein
MQLEILKLDIAAIECQGLVPSGCANNITHNNTNVTAQLNVN